MKWLNFPEWLPENVSTFGQGVDNLFILIYWITSIVFLAVMAVLIVFIIKYRFQEGRKADYIEGSTTLEITWTSCYHCHCVRTCNVEFATVEQD